MADAAQIVEGMGADIVDINMGCPVPKIAKHNAGCSLMREPEHAASVIRAMAQGGQDSGDRQDARWLERDIHQRADAREDGEDAGAAAIRRARRTAAQSYTGESDWSLIARVAEGVRIPVFGSGDCVEADHVVTRLRDRRRRRRARRSRVR
jgi:tRNA-dihydrouridine synthase B